MQAREAREDLQQVQSQSTDHSGGFDQAAPGIMPAPKQQEPMLNHHRDQFGIQFAQCLPGQLRAPGIDLALTLPEFEEQFDEPAFAQQDEGLLHADMLGGSIGDHQGPLCQLPLLLTHHLAFLTSLFTQALATLLGYLTWNTHHEQAHRQGIVFPQRDVHDLDLPNGSWQRRLQIDALSLLVVEDGVGLGVLAEEYALLGQLPQTLQSPLAAVSHIQAACRKRLLSERPVQFMYASGRQVGADELTL